MPKHFAKNTRKEEERNKKAENERAANTPQKDGR